MATLLFTKDRQPPHGPGEAVYSNDKAVITVAGAFNFGHGDYSTAAAHFSPLRHALKETCMPVSQPIVPKKLGLFGSLEAAYHAFNDDVDATLGSQRRLSNPILVGHSLGGLFALRRHAERGSGGVITLGSPHGPMRRFPFLPEWTEDLHLYGRRCKAMAEFSKLTFQMLAESGDTENVIFAGSTLDEVVPVRSSLPAVAGIKRVLFGPPVSLPLDHHSVEHIPNTLMEHGMLLTHAAATRFVVDSVIRMADPAYDRPEHDNIVPARFGNPALA